MAYLVAKRLWDGELVPLLSARCTQGKATAVLGIAYCEPGKRVGASQPGDVWLEVHHQNGDILTDPVIFPIDQARPVLLKLGVLAEQVDIVLSDAFADEGLKALRTMVAESLAQGDQDAES